MSHPRTSRADLLKPISRWTWEAKFWLCHGIDKAVITAVEAIRVHDLTAEELNHWFSRYRERGANGLKRVNRIHRRRVA